MDALTLWQPWAGLVVWGGKRVENRKRFPPKKLIGKRFAIHAGLVYDDSAEERFGAEVKALHRMARVHGAIIGTAVLDFAVRGPEGLPPELRRWFFGPVGWVLKDIRPVKPVWCRGFVGVWRVPSDVEAQLEAA